MKFLIFIFLLAGCATTSASQQVYFNLKMENTGANGDYYNSVYYNVPMVLEFYFNTCPACNTNAPKVRKLAETHHNFFNQIIDVSIDCEPSDYKAWLRKHSDKFPVLNDCDRSLAESLNVTAYPTTIVLDENHRVIHRSIGVWNDQKEAKIKSYLRNSHE